MKNPNILFYPVSGGKAAVWVIPLQVIAASVYTEDIQPLARHGHALDCMTGPGDCCHQHHHIALTSFVQVTSITYSHLSTLLKYYRIF